jgi:NB-ARC domain
MTELDKPLRIVVASPSDVQSERDRVPVVVEEVNRWIASFVGLQFEVVRWETDSYPAFHLEGPQGLIDRILRIEDSDILVGIFWKRFGKPTKDGTTGTEHEIRQAYEGWKRNSRPQIMVYFNQKPYSPASKQETDQWGQVLEFKKSFPAEGLWWPYKGKTEFERLLRNHLINFIRDNYLLDGGTQTLSPMSPAVRQMLLLPVAPGILIGREDGLLELKRRLGIASNDQNGTGRLAVVRGWPGVGKSSVAAALAYDSEARATYQDGILWTSLGPKPSLLSALATWGRVLGTNELFKAPTLKEATARLTTLLSHKKMLLIVDDVWETEHAAPFQQIRGDECGLLFTTRETHVAEAIAPLQSAIYNLPVLTPETGLELLTLLAPFALAEYPNESKDLVHDLECLPLALQVAGRTLNAEAKLGWSVKEMLIDLRTGAGIIAQKAPADRADLETQTIPTVAALLRQSTDRLDEFTRDCFSFLGPFAPKPATFDMDALKSVWQVEDPRPVIRNLVSHGLMEPVGGRFQMHALLVAHARSLLIE